MGSGYIVQRGGGSKPSGTISITENGTVDVTEYAAANVNVKDYSAFKTFVDRSITEVTAEMLDGATSIGKSAFSSCSALASITIPSSVTSIQGSAFSYCTSLASITIPSSVTNIDEYAFNSCRALTSITIPSSVTIIWNSAFSSCSALASVTVEATTPPNLGSTVFNNTHADLVIYVPAESVDAYKAATNWSTYASRIQAIPST